MYHRKTSKILFPGRGQFLTNIDKAYKESLLKAVNELALNIWWEDNATDCEDYPLDDCVAVYTTSTRDLTEFWDLYHHYRDITNENQARETH